MKLGSFLPEEARLGKQYKNFLSFKKKLEESGVPENVATYKASMLLEPKKLEKIKVLANKKGEGTNRVISFFFNSDEELELVAKYFDISVLNNREPQIGHSDLLISILKELENLK